MPIVTHRGDVADSVKKLVVNSCEVVTNDHCSIVVSAATESAAVVDCCCLDG